MSKLLGNVIYFFDDVDILKKKVMFMYIDFDYIYIEDLGKVEGNVVFMYFDIFDEDKVKVVDLKVVY